MREDEGVFQLLPRLLTGNDIGKKTNQVVLAEAAHNGVGIQRHGKGGGHDGLQLLHVRALNARDAYQRQHAFLLRLCQHLFQDVAEGQIVEHGHVVVGGFQRLRHVPVAAALHIAHENKTVDITGYGVPRQTDRLGNPGDGAPVVNAAILHDDPALPAHKGVEQMLAGKARIVGVDLVLVVQTRFLGMHCIRIVDGLRKGFAGLVALPEIVDHVLRQVDALVGKQGGAQHFLHQALLQQGAADAARRVGNEGADDLEGPAAVVADLAIGDGHPAIDVRRRQAYGENGPVLLLSLQQAVGKRLEQR